MFKHAIVKTPGKSMLNGLSTAGLGPPDYHLALEQHQNYIKALQKCGLAVTILPPDEAYPDACFVEDAAVLTANCAIITRPGAASRRGEVAAIEQAVAEFYPQLEYIQAPGTLDGGDVMMVGKHFYIGLSERTNAAGATQLFSILQAHGMDGSTVALDHLLHLKTGVSYIENNHLVVGDEMNDKPEFAAFKRITVTADEAYAANCIWVNDRVIIPAGFPRSQAALVAAGYEVIAVDVSEFEKLDGGLSCLSLRF
ncbi:arginine deiminase family protein [Marinicella sp. S1101]|uniref:dimethylarginine dimethylaminohydrolase family protein n=1 Tax=Marinicella marina TaxID=2996016 RepID=UPI00226101FA|nr:arginine deiminase family protein [Marinicella marina]MCX7553111.1 arginine deiminase family protein [Marinicella marina]MDJ1138843.1 arginine deiminase family protein [Marinicella marina]